jgi:hypothetical protein
MIHLIENERDLQEHRVVDSFMSKYSHVFRTAF